MSDRDLKLHATVAELLAYLHVDQEPEKFLEGLTNKKGYTPTVYIRQLSLQYRDPHFLWQKRLH